jgi:hypothetical protein
MSALTDIRQRIRMECARVKKGGTPDRLTIKSFVDDICRVARDCYLWKSDPEKNQLFEAIFQLVFLVKLSGMDIDIERLESLKKLM